jgi:hypothetical protein
VQLESSTSTSSGNGGTNECTSPLPPGGSTQTSPPAVGNLLIAGDGYAYVPYRYDTSQGTSTAAPSDSCGDSYASSGTDHLHIMRVGSGGDSYELSLGDWQWTYSGYYYNYGQSASSSGNKISSVLPNLITNSNQGVLASFALNTTTYGSGGATATTYYLATTSGTGVTSSSKVTALPARLRQCYPYCSARTILTSEQSESDHSPDKSQTPA